MNINRRNFLKSTGIAGVGLIAVPTIISSCVKGANDKINVGFIGTGSHCYSWNLRNYLALDDCKIVALCDVDKIRLKKTRAMLKKKGVNTSPKLYNDWRDLLERKDIDAVQITTPDHWHVYMSIAALKAGKHVCCEKPTLTIEQGRILVNEVNNYNKVFQTSMEDRWLESYYRMAKLVREGRIGQLKRMRVGLPSESKIVGNADTSIQKPPKYFDYDMWLGPAAEVPYRPAACHYNFRWNFNFSGGSITDWGAHLIDTAQLCNFAEKSGPISVEGAGVQNDGIFDTFKKYDLNYIYENGVEMNIHGKSVEIYVEGTEGWLHVEQWNKELKASNPELLNVTENEIVTEKGHINEHDNFLKCIRSGEEAGHPAEDMHRTATVAHIGNAAMLLGRKLEWDPKKERFVNDDEANSMLSKEERAPWILENLVNS